MIPELRQIFGPYLRDHPLSRDGRPLSIDGPGIVAAEALFRQSPSENARTIVDLLRPYCSRFDVEQVIGALAASQVESEDRARAENPPEITSGTYAVEEDEAIDRIEESVAAGSAMRG